MNENEGGQRRAGGQVGRYTPSAEGRESLEDITNSRTDQAGAPVRYHPAPKPASAEYAKQLDHMLYFTPKKDGKRRVAHSKFHTMHIECLRTSKAFSRHAIISSVCKFSDLHDDVSF